jgi:TRAP-type C4-dicarboxylate transport system permease small subunit
VDRAAEPQPSDDVALEDLFQIDLDWRRWWTIIPEIVVLACTGALPVLVALGVISRYTDWFRVPWVQDIVGVLFLWIVFLGGAIAVKHEAHVRMGTFAERLAAMGPRGQAWDTVIRASPLLLGVILLMLGIRIADLHMTRELTWLQIPLGPFSSVIPISGALIIWYTLDRLRSGRSSAGGDGNEAEPSSGEV